MFADLFAMLTPSNHPTQPDLSQTVEFDSPQPRDPLAYPTFPPRPTRARHLFPAESVSAEAPDQSAWD